MQLTLSLIRNDDKKLTDLKEIEDKKNTKKSKKKKNNLKKDDKMKDAKNTPTTSTQTQPPSSQPPLPPLSKLPPPQLPPLNGTTSVTLHKCLNLLNLFINHDSDILVTVKKDFHTDFKFIFFRYIYLNPILTIQFKLFMLVQALQFNAYSLFIILNYTIIFFYNTLRDTSWTFETSSTVCQPTPPSHSPLPPFW